MSYISYNMLLSWRTHSFFNVLSSQSSALGEKIPCLSTSITQVILTVSHNGREVPD